MLYPSIFGENLMDDVFDDVDRDMEREFNSLTKRNPLFGKNAKRLMKTDVRETDKSFEVSVDLPGIKKEDIELSLRDGYLTISADKGMEKSTEDKKGRLIRKERYTGAMERSFFVGEDLTEEDITAKFDNGVLKLSIPKKEEKKPEHKAIKIE